MSELKVASLFEFEKVLQGRSNKLFYSKSEADKVIAERKEKYNELAKLYDKAIQACCDADKVIAHHKYKRCLAMAERCNDKIDNPVERDEHDGWLIITEYWERWHKRWLELAEKFKEAK